MTEKITPETWNKVWEKQQDSWDYLSEIYPSHLWGKFIEDRVEYPYGLKCLSRA